MKKLLITMLAILAFNVSYASNMGEEQGIPNQECSKTRGDASRAAKVQIDDSTSSDSTDEFSVIKG